MAAVEDRHDSLVAFLISAIGGGLAQYNQQERSLGTTAATQPEIDKALAEVVCWLTETSDAGIEQFIDLLRMAAADDWGACL